MPYSTVFWKSSDVAMTFTEGVAEHPEFKIYVHFVREFYVISTTHLNKMLRNRQS